jgi:hypothetical protein
MFSRGRVCLALSLIGLVTGCPDDEPIDPPTPDPAFPPDYASSYTEVRDCRQSGDHDLNVVRILADPAALAPYRDRDQPFAAGAVVLKEEYDFGDTSCTGDIKQWTVMVRLDEGSAPDTLDWKWQQVDAARNVVGEDTPRCYGCHTGCTPATDGYEHTCAVP